MQQKYGSNKDGNTQCMLDGREIDKIRRLASFFELMHEGLRVNSQKPASRSLYLALGRLADLLGPVYME